MKQFNRKDNKPRKTNAQQLPPELELAPIPPSATKAIEPQFIKYRAPDGSIFEYPPIPDYLLDYDPTAYYNLEGVIQTKDPTKTEFYMNADYLPKRLKQSITAGTANAKQLKKAEEHRILYLLTQYRPTAKEHQDLLEELKKVHDFNSDRAINPGTVISAITSIAGIVLVLNHERAHFIGTKALNFVLKPTVK